mgnify:CR=1 FL=1
MKRFPLSVALFFLLLSGWISSTVAQEGALNSVSIENRTGFELSHLFLSPGESGLWGVELLGSKATLKPERTVEYFVHYREECERFDVMAIDVDGDSYLLTDHEICDGQGESVTITLDDFRGPAPELVFVELRLVNELPYDIVYLFVSPADSPSWGADSLSTTGVLKKGRLASVYVPASQERATYHLMAVDEASDIYSFAIDVSADKSMYQFPIELADLHEVAN